MTETSPKVAPSLLDEVVIGPVRSAFNIGMDEWLDAPMLGPVYPGHEAKQPHPTTAAAKQPHPTTSAKQPHPTTAKQPHPTTAAKQPHPTTKPPKKRRSSTAAAKQLEPQQKKSRFSVLSEVELNDLSKPASRGTQNHLQNGPWTILQYGWKTETLLNSSEQCPESLLEDMNSTQLNKWLSIAETRKSQWRPGHTLYHHFTYYSPDCSGIWEALNLTRLLISLPKMTLHFKGSITQWTPSTENFVQVVSDLRTFYRSVH